MAKGNLFLGTAARSVGDVVMYRREGSQVSRVRVRKIANPRTDAQSLQRAVFSPVAKFFSPLAIVLERAWEGVSKSKSYSEFLKENIKRARTNGWLLPKGTGFFPLPYQLTKGTLRTLSYILDGNQLSVNIGFDTEAAVDFDTIGDLSRVFSKMGYNKGDIVTFIIISGTASTGYYPNTYQFEIDSESTANIVDVMPGLNVSSIVAGDSEFKVTNNDGAVAGAVVVARFENDKWRRSTQDLVVSQTILTEIGTAAYKAAAVASYGNTAGSINPLVYLDGKDLEG